VFSLQQISLRTLTNRKISLSREKKSGN